MTKRTHPSDKKNRRKKFAALLVSFHKNLKRSCDSFTKVSAWYAYLKNHLQPILDEYGDELPPEILKKIKSAMKLTDESKTGIHEACKQLRGDIGKIAANMAGRGFLGSAVLGVFLVGALAIGGLVAYLNMSAVTITLTNDGCDTMTIAGNIPVSLPGLSLPPNPIKSGESATLTVPPLKATVDGMAPGGITITMFGFTVRFAVTPSIRVTLDGAPLVGVRTEVNLGSAPTHTAVVSC